MSAETDRLFRDEPQWKKFERTVHRIHQLFASPGTKIKYDDKIFGEESLRKRQIDISIRTEVNGSPVLIVVECKDTGRPIDSPEMASFAGLVSDVRANKGVLVSRGGFTEGALNIAKARGLDTQVYGEADLPLDASIPVLSILKTISWQAIFSHLPGLPIFRIPNDPQKLMTYDTGGNELGKLEDLARDIWSASQNPEEPGKYTIPIANPPIIRTNGYSSHAWIQMIVLVEARYFVGHLPLERQELLDAATRKPVFLSARTGSVDLAELKNGHLPGWIELPNATDLAITPLFTFTDGGWIPQRGAHPVPPNAAYVEFFVPRS